MLYNAKLGNIVAGRENFPIQPYNSLFFFFFSFGKVREGGIHVEMNFLNCVLLEFEWLLGVGMAGF